MFLRDHLRLWFISFVYAVNHLVKIHINWVVPFFQCGFLLRRSRDLLRKPWACRWWLSRVHLPQMSGWFFFFKRLPPGPLSQKHHNRTYPCIIHPQLADSYGKLMTNVGIFVPVTWILWVIWPWIKPPNPFRNQYSDPAWYHLCFPN